MPNLSEGLIQQGVVIGREEGALNTTVKNILSMINHGISKKDAFALLDVDASIKQEVLKKLKEVQDVKFI